MKMPSHARPLFWRFAVAAYSFGMTFALPVSAAPPPSVPISQVPLTVVIPAHPQIVLALGNSQSMDGDLSGAIYTGSGGLGSYPELANSASPVNYTIPGGFTPPVNPGSAGMAPYTVVSGGLQTDNSASRLNVAKAGITSILSNYIADARFCADGLPGRRLDRVHNLGVPDEPAGRVHLHFDSRRQRSSSPTRATTSIRPQATPWRRIAMASPCITEPAREFSRNLTWSSGQAATTR